MNQVTNNILMIKPISFRYNEQTAINNYYQRVLNNLSQDLVQLRALEEFNNFVNILENARVNVIVVEDTNEFDTPDSIFPNNWVSFHADGKVGLYPMCAKNRRNERREDILDSLRDDYGFDIKLIKDFSESEQNDKYLEGTGSMVLDRDNKICYAAISIRTDEDLVKKFCNVFGYKLVSFKANQNIEGSRVAIYHTNVMMCIADKFAIICLDSIDDEVERKRVIQSINDTGKEIIEITQEQKHRFAGNMLQVMGDKYYLVMSESAFNSLTGKQKIAIQKYNEILYSSLDTIEACGGGSARCMMAEVFLPNN